MILQEHLLLIASEECNEVAHRISKALRFGLREVEPGQGKNNAERIVEEFSQLYAVIHMLHDKALLPVITDPGEFVKKMDKVGEFLEYSRKCGTLTE